MGGKRLLTWMYWDSLEMMSEEELHRPSDQINLKVQVKGQVQVLVHLHCNLQIKPKIVQC